MTEASDFSEEVPLVPDGFAASFSEGGRTVQRRARAEPNHDGVHAAAARGIATPSTALPFQEQLESSLGQDLSGIHAHVGGAAEKAAADMSAEAFAAGDHVVLPASPSLHTVAHEVAHVFQQREGVHLKGGVGEVGDDHERHADAVADAVVRGELVENAGAGTPSRAAGAGVQRKAGPEPATPEGPEGSESGGSDDAQEEVAPELVSITVNWSGKFEGDLSAVVTIEGTNEIKKSKKGKGKGKKGTKTEWVVLATETVLDPDGADGAESAATTVAVQVPRYTYYRASIDPVTEKPDDRYKRTDVGTKVEPTADAVVINKQLDIERWNRKNVNDVWADKRIDESKAAEVMTVALFGRHVEVHKEVAPRVAKTNALYEGLSAEMKLEIQDSMFVMGGYAVRTTSRGSFSNHSIGFAIDINYSMGTKQNYGKRPVNPTLAVIG